MRWCSLSAGCNESLPSSLEPSLVRQNFWFPEEKRLRAMSEISNVSEGTSENVEVSRPSSPRARPGNLLNTIRVADDIPFCEQLSSLWSNTLFCRATVAFASSNYINAGLAFIWIRLFVQLWTMEKQISVVSFLAITGGGRNL